MYTAKDAYKKTKGNLGALLLNKRYAIEKDISKRIKSAVAKGEFTCYSQAYIKGTVCCQALEQTIMLFECLGYKVERKEEKAPFDEIIVFLNISWNLDNGNATET